MIGQRTWAIPEGYIPGRSVGEASDLVSHEAMCLLNSGGTAASVEIMLCFEDHDPLGAVKAPRDTSDASVIHSMAPMVVQRPRWDTRDPSVALLSTMTFPIWG